MWNACFSIAVYLTNGKCANFAVGPNWYLCKLLPSVLHLVLTSFRKALSDARKQMEQIHMRLYARLADRAVILLE